MTSPPQTTERRVEVAKTLLEVENRSFLGLLVTSDENEPEQAERVGDT